MAAVNPPNHRSNSNQGFRVLLRTLRYRNYRLFFFGQGISLIGTWMQQIAAALHTGGCRRPVIQICLAGDLG